MPTTRINDAIQQCLNYCRGAEAPLARLARFCDELRESGWNESDVRAVELAVVRLLSGMIPKDDSG